MSFGLSGSHRSGKSTLAQATAKALGIHYLDASTTAIMEGTGFNPVAPGATIGQRLRAQDYLLKEFTKMAMKAPYPFISDRTPLDHAAYMLGELTMHNATAEVGAKG
jgi:cytidylate kinase